MREPSVWPPVSPTRIERAACSFFFSAHGRAGGAAFSGPWPTLYEGVAPLVTGAPAWAGVGAWPGPWPACAAGAWWAAPCPACLPADAASEAGSAAPSSSS